MGIVSCKSCGKEIVWLKTNSGKAIPVNAETIQDKETMYNYKIGHISHFSNCPDSKAWRKVGGK